ncbi:MAG TPA: SDR family NAD(P)-dependent oxidoreductase [Candidatus Dormibacteraeota bacterium]
MTGAAQGIGQGIVKMLLAESASVLAFDRDEDLLRQAVGGFGGRVEPFVGSVTDRADIEAAVEAAEKRLGPVDILVNNAGVWVIKPFLEETYDDFERVLHVNLRGTWLFMKAVAPLMVERGRGVIVNLSSVSAKSYTVPAGIYGATKAGIAALTRDVGFELAGHGVRVNAIAPGNIANPRRSNIRPPSRGLPLGSGDADDIARAVRFLVSDDSRYVIGVTLSVAGGADLSVSIGWA